eukprot:3439736-Rhodomonas_salina.2
MVRASRTVARPLSTHERSQRPKPPQSATPGSPPPDAKGTGTRRASETSAPTPPGSAVPGPTPMRSPCVTRHRYAQTPGPTSNTM